VKHDKPEPHAASPVDVFATMLNPATLEKSASVFGKGVRTFQEEGMRFFNRRMEDNAKTMRAFAACRTLPDVFAAQQKWFADMTRTYSEEWTRYGELVNGLVEDEREEDAKAQGNGRAGRASH